MVFIIANITYLHYTIHHKGRCFMNYFEESLKLHYNLQGKIEVVSRAEVSNKEELSLAYTPGVAQPCLEIQKDLSKSYELTRRWNLVAVVTDGTAVLGLGDIGPEAGMPVMEGKCVLFKKFGDVDAFPLCVKSKDVDEIVKTIQLISGSFGGINLEDISAPRCFEIEEKLKACTDIPIFHDDQHGTAVVCTAAMINSLKLINKKFEDCTIVISGAGAAGVAICNLLQTFGAKDVIVCDRKGAINATNRPTVEYKAKLGARTNKRQIDGSLADAMKGADIFIGVSAPGIVTKEMVESMNKDPLIFAMSNPTPEIDPELAKEAGAKIVGTGRSDYPNQINNVLAFPGIFRGTFDAHATTINEEMKVAAAKALASLVSDEELSVDYILPRPFDPRVCGVVSAAVKQAAIDSKVCR